MMTDVRTHLVPSQRKLPGHFYTQLSLENVGYLYVSWSSGITVPISFSTEDLLIILSYVKMSISEMTM